MDDVKNSTILFFLYFFSKNCVMCCYLNLQGCRSTMDIAEIVKMRLPSRYRIFQTPLVSLYFFIYYK